MKVVSLSIILLCIAISIMNLGKTNKVTRDAEPIILEIPMMDVMNHGKGIENAEELKQFDPKNRTDPWALTWKTIFAENESISLEKMRQASSVDYYACCGLGHRLSKNADAYYIASRKLNFSFRTQWGKCDETEVHQHLFGPQPPSLLPLNVSTGSTVKLRNNVYGFKKLIRSGNEESCEKDCGGDKFASDVEYFQSLADRFRMRHKVDDFVRDNRFHEHTVLGMHIRAGNNETGDFTKKNRGIRDPLQWVNDVVSQLLNFTKQQQLPKPPLLYVATDTPSMVTMFNESLTNVIPVIQYEQKRTPEGSGVLFGGKPKDSGSDCLSGWEDAVIDIMLLGRSDIAIAARPSSFIQTLPLTLALSRKENLTTPSYCEFNYNATSMRCFHSYHDWCCHGTSAFTMAGFSNRYESRHVPFESYNYTILQRPIKFEMHASNYLPYDYPQ
mmetsp:Transcript_7906/g.12094  ORF Transcript_7906/g.12094 Transcript_7906/m.12094 type:complete len:443 (-) Transcript_7906:369-1697(-)